MKKYLVLFLFCSYIANATTQNSILNSNQQILDNTSTQSIANIENNLNTTTTMLRESENVQLNDNQTQLENTQTNIQTQNIQNIQNTQDIRNIQNNQNTNQLNKQKTNQKYQLSTHILDINKGQPANNVNIVLYKLVSNQWIRITEGKTDENGRITNFLPTNIDNSGTYRLSFLVKEYFENQGLKSIYPYIDVVFNIEGTGHYHIPITLSANGYSTYRGN